jgi:hypothetical protein
MLAALAAQCLSGSNRAIAASCKLPEAWHPISPRQKRSRDRAGTSSNKVGLCNQVNPPLTDADIVHEEAHSV